MSWCDREVRKKARGRCDKAAHLVGERTDVGRPVGGRTLSNRSVEALAVLVEPGLLDLRDHQVDRLRDLEAHHELEPGGQTGLASRTEAARYDAPPFSMGELCRLAERIQ
jgi:hypothetical protein